MNWCPALGTVLANEEVIDGKSERGGHPVERRPLRQWMLRITAYADRLENDLESLDWSEGIKALQRNWIGRSVGVEVDFPLRGGGEPLSIFTTRPDTLFGATYMVLAPEHPLVDSLTSPEQQANVDKYRVEAAAQSELERMAAEGGKTGVFTGAYAINPVNNQRVPIWVADYVLMGYGTGAIMAVPGQDQRDWDFAQAHGLPIIPVVLPPDHEGPITDYEASVKHSVAYEGDGTLINSGPYNGLTVEEALANSRTFPSSERSSSICAGMW